MANTDVERDSRLLPWLTAIEKMGKQKCDKCGTGFATAYIEGIIYCDSYYWNINGNCGSKFSGI